MQTATAQAIIPFHVKRKKKNILRNLYKVPGSPYWYCNFVLNGKRFIFSTKTTDEKLAHQIYIAERSKRQRIDYKLEQQKTKLKDLLQTYLDKYAKTGKITYKDTVGKCNRMIGFFSDRMANDITPQELETYRAQRIEQGKSKSTVNRELSVLRHAYNKGIEWGLCDTNPVKKIKFYSEKENQRTRYLTEQEKWAFFNAFIDAEKTAEVRNKFMLEKTRKFCYFAMLTGMRRGEIMAMKWTDIDYNNGLIKIGHTKTGVPRFGTMNGEVTTLLKSLPQDSEWPFGRGGKDSKADWAIYKKHFEKAVKDAGLVDFKLHDCRHTFASDLTMAGVGMKAVMELMGHKTLAMTERYSHLAPGYKRQAVEGLPGGFLNKCLNSAKVEQPQEQDIEIRTQKSNCALSSAG